MNTCQSCTKPTSGSVLCDGCRSTFAWALTHVGVYYADLVNAVETKSTRYGAGAATRGSIGKTQPLPVDSRFLDRTGDGSQLVNDTHETLRAWCQGVMDVLPERIGPACPDCIHLTCTGIRRDRWPVGTVPSMVNYLARQYRYLLAQDDAAELLGEMTDLENRLRRMVDRPAERLYLGTCIADDCPGAVYAIDGKPTGSCNECEAEYDVKASRDGLNRALDDHLCTAAEIVRLASYLGLSVNRERLRKRINQWHSRGRITARGADETGAPRFAYGEVRGLIFAEFARPTGAA